MRRAVDIFSGASKCGSKNIDRDYEHEIKEKELLKVFSLAKVHVLNFVSKRIFNNLSYTKTILNRDTYI